MPQYILEVYRTLPQTWEPHHFIKPSTDLERLSREAKASVRKMIRENRRASRDLRPNSYGSFDIPYLRIVKSDGTFVEWINKPPWMRDDGTTDYNYIVEKPVRRIIRND